jgi:hypothetical protein
VFHFRITGDNTNPVQLNPPPTRVYITWKELFDERPNESSVLDFVQTLNKQNATALLATIMTTLFLDRAFGSSSETIKLQGFLIAKLFDNQIFDRAKERLGKERLDHRIAFHPQQILLMMKWVILHSQPAGGISFDTDEALFALGGALLKTNDFLITAQMTAKIAEVRRAPSVKNMLRLQLSVGAGNEVANPPPLINGLARSIVIFDELQKTTKTPIDLNKALLNQSGLSLSEYIDLTVAVLANYLGRTPQELIDNPNISVISPRTYFGPLISTELASRFWQMESATVDALGASLASSSNLLQHQDFTAFRMKPFIQFENGNMVCLNPGFVQEKLETGLFWTIANSLEAKDRQYAFDSWGKLFEAYVNQSFVEAVDPAVERYIPCPDFVGKQHRHESFDAILLSDEVCAVFECKGGFLPNKAKYGDDLDQFLNDLDKKFGTQDGAGVEQLARKMGQIFARDEKTRRKIEGCDLTGIKIVVPVLVVQDSFVSSLLSAPWLIKSFRDLMRKTTSINVIWPSLLVLHVEDVEKLSLYVRSRAVSLSECLLAISKLGDPSPGKLFSFEGALRGYLAEKEIGKIPDHPLVRKFSEVMNRMTMRLFNRPFEPPKERDE